MYEPFCEHMLLLLSDQHLEENGWVTGEDAAGTFPELFCHVHSQCILVARAPTLTRFGVISLFNFNPYGKRVLVQKVATLLTYLYISRLILPNTLKA